MIGQGSPKMPPGQIVTRPKKLPAQNIEEPYIPYITHPMSPSPKSRPVQNVTQAKNCLGYILGWVTFWRSFWVSFLSWMAF